MSAFDKSAVSEKLKAAGWTEVDGSGWRFSPPEILWTNRPKDFHVYEAEELQELLSGPLPAEDDVGPDNE